MSDKLLFDVLGKDGAAAMERAIKNRPGLEGAVRPRVALAWAQEALRVGYKGPAPGSPEIMVNISKGEGWVFGEGDNQVVGLEDSAPHLAACILANSGGAIGIVPRTKSMALLGANLDAMCKAELTKAAIKPPGAGAGVEAPGPAAAARPPKPPSAPQAPTAPSRAATKPAVAAMPKVVGAKPSGAATGAPKPPKPPAMKAEGQGLVLPGFKSRAVKLTKAELQRACNSCGKPQLVDQDLIGCVCHCDSLSKSEIVPIEDGFAVRFDDPEALVIFLEDIGHA